MSDKPSTTITRRTLVAGAGVVVTALTSEPASAQRCPAVPPPRAKGPLIWLDMDQQDLDDAYDQNVYAFNAKNISDRRREANALALSIIGKPQRVAYGLSQIEMLDIYKTKRPNAPTLIFIHGGGWRNGKSSDFTVYAEPYIKAGANFIALDFANVGQTNGDLFPMVEQVRRAVGWVYRNAASFGGDPNALYLCSRSSGSHLAGCVVITEWETQGLPRDILKGGAFGSGMYDLKAVRLSKRGKYVKFTDAMEHELSPQRHLDRIHTPLVLCNGSSETPEFLRQSREFAAALQAAGKPAKYIVAKGYNHYEMGETIGHPYGIIGRALMRMMKLDTV